MEDENEEDDDFREVKRKKISSVFEKNSHTQSRSNRKPKRGVSFSLKSTRSKKKACSIRTYFLEQKQDEIFGTSKVKDQLTFCPVCQLPFVGLIGQSFESHVQECLTNYTESSVLCPCGINCNSMAPRHFTQYSHQQLANLRSVEITRNKTGTEEIQNAEHIVKVTYTGSHLENSLTNHSKNTSYSSLKPSDTNHDTSCVDTPNTVNNTEKAEQTLPMLEDILGTENTLENETQSSEKENIDQWFNDGLEYEDFEMNSNECTPSPESTNSNANCANSVVKNTETSVETTSNTSATSAITNLATNITRTSETATSVAIMSKTEKTTSSDTKSQCSYTGSIKEDFTLNKSAETQAQSQAHFTSSIKTSGKQMDIGIYFGLKPKNKVTSNKVGNVFGKVLQQKEVSLKEQNETQCSEGKSRNQSKKCPFYKIVEGTSFAVDAFSYGHIPGISAYFLSHFHYDHYGGLKRSFSRPIYCSQITANLISLKIKVAAHFIHALSLYNPTMIENIEVTLLEANHCPGAVMFIFKLPNGQTHLHTGDFRASTAMVETLFLRRSSSSIHTLYLDTTYCDPSYSFPPQSETIKYCVAIATEAVERNSKTLIVVGTYTIGKEKIFVAVANALDCKAAVQRDKYNVLQCLESDHLKNIITQDFKEAQVHVLPMAHLTHKKLAAHLDAHSSKYSELLAFKPTGWTFTDNCENDLKNIKPSKRASVTIFGVPYSEHSSYNELKQFVQHIKPHKIIPTVNNGSAARREEMKNIFQTWLGN